MSEDNDGSGGRTLGGGDSEPLPAGWGSSSAPRVGRIGGAPSRIIPSSAGRTVSLRDIVSSGQGPAPTAQGRSDGDDSEDEGGENWYTGGERSGLNVQNPERPSGPNNTIRDILRKAAQAPRQAAPPSRPSAFSGAGVKLGSDDIDSEFIPDASASAVGQQEQDTVIRHLTFWRDGFSVEDGPLMRYDNPENQRILDAINSGNAPPSILNVQVNQPVELLVSRRVDETYVAPPKKPFAGTGNRLGGVVPAASSPASTLAIPGAFPSATAISSTSSEREVESIRTRFEADLSQPNTSVQIRLADGTRLVCRMNLTHTVGDIRGFINASRPASQQRLYTIGTTFPNKTLDDDSITIEAAGLKNSVIVQRWM